jgi:hypothetical protein
MKKEKRTYWEKQAIAQMTSKDRWAFYKLERLGYKRYNEHFDEKEYYLWVYKKHNYYDLVVTLTNTAGNKAEWRYPQSLNIHVTAYMDLHTLEGFKRLQEFENFIIEKLSSEDYFEDKFANHIRGEKYEL